MNAERPKSDDRNDASRRRPDLSDEPTPLESLGNRVYKTYGARRELAKRLQTRGDYWNAALVIIALVTAVSSVALLVDREVLGTRGDVILAVLGVLTLVASLMVSARDYKVRSVTAFDVYRQMQRLSTDIEAAMLSPSKEGIGKAWSSFDARYQDLLDGSENHSQPDYFRARHPIWAKSAEGRKSDWHVKNDIVGLPRYVVRWVSVWISMLATAIPLLLALASAGLLVPIVGWLAGG